MWGADVDAQGAAFCHIRRNPFEVHFTRVAVRCDPGPDRLRLILRQLMSHTVDAADRYPPVAVFIEIPMGQHRRPELDHAYGLIAGGTAQLLDALFPHPVSVFAVNTSSWKKAIFGGLPKKPEYMAMAATNPLLEGLDSDAVVAYCLARYGEIKLAENA